MTSAISTREVLARLFELFATACLFLFSAQALEAQQPHGKAGTQYFIERVEIVGNRHVRSARILACILSRPGDPYSAGAVRRDVQALRDTGFFADVRLEVEDNPDRPNAKIVAFYVSEKPIIRRIEYRGIKSITESDILNALNDKKVGLSVGRQFDQAKLTRAVVAIEAVLSAHGRPSATVKPTYEKIAAANTVTIVFDIDEGPVVAP
jgi:outer membrane protein insertion porin family